MELGPGMIRKTAWIAVMVLWASRPGLSRTLIEQIGWRGAGIPAIAGFLGFVFGILALLIFMHFRKKRQNEESSRKLAAYLFKKNVDDLELTRPEAETVRLLSAYEKETQPHVVLQSISMFEKCVDAHVSSLLAQKPGDERLQEENRRLSDIRRKAGFRHLPLEHPLVSTRNLSLGQTGAVFGENKRNPLIHRATVTEINEFTFSLQYDVDNEDVFYFDTNGELKFAFARQSDGMYGVPLKLKRADGSGVLEAYHTLSLLRNQLRRYVRIEANLALRFRLISTSDPEKSAIPRGSTAEGKIADISGGGLSFLCEESLRVGDRISASFAFPGGEFAGVLCKVLRISLQEGKTKTMYRHHVQFVELEGRRRDAVVRYVFEKQRRMHQLR